MKPSILKTATQKQTSLRHISLEEEIQAHVDMVEAQGQIEKSTAEIDHAEDAISALEDLALVCDKIEEPTKTEAALIQITGNALAAGTDVDPANFTPSMEDDDGAKGFVQKTKDAIRRIIEAIKAALTRMWNWVKSFFTNCNLTLDARAKRAKTLQESLKKIKARGEISIEVSKGSLFQKDTSGAEVLKMFNEEQKELTTYRDFCKKIMDNILQKDILSFDQATSKYVIQGVEIAAPSDVRKNSKQVVPGLNLVTVALRMKTLNATVSVSYFQGRGTFDNIEAAKKVFDDWVTDFSYALDDHFGGNEEGHRVKLTFKNPDEVVKCVQAIELCDAAIRDINNDVFKVGGKKLEEYVSRHEDKSEVVIKKPDLNDPKSFVEIISVSLSQSTRLARSMSASTLRMLQIASRTSAMMHRIIVNVIDKVGSK